MADESINIRITADAEEAKALKEELKSITQQIKLVELEFKRGNVTAETAKDRFSELQTRIEGLGVEEENLVDVNQRLWHANNRVGIGFKSLATEVKGIGENLASRATPAVGAFGNMIESSNMGMTSMVNSSTSMIQQFVRLSSAAGGAGGAMKAMIASMAGPGGLVLVISVVGTLAALFKDKLFPSVEETRKAIQELRDVLFELGELNFEEKMGGLVKRMNELYREAKKLNELGWFEKMLGAIPGLGLTPFLGSVEAIQKRTEAEKTRLKIQRDTTKELKEQNELALSNAEAARLWAKMHLKGARALGGPPEVPKLEQVVEPTGLVPDKNFVRDQLAQVEVEFGDFFSFYSDKLGGMESAWTASIQTMGGEVSQWIEGAFARSFNGVNSLFEKMVVNFASALAQMAVQAAAYAFLSYLFPGLSFFTTAGAATVARAGGGPIDEPVVGRGMRTGKRWTFGEQGSEWVVPNHQLSSSYMARGGATGGGGSSQPIVLETRIRGNDLVLVQAKASLGRRGRTM